MKKIIIACLGLALSVFWVPISYAEIAEDGIYFSASVGMSDYDLLGEAVGFEVLVGKKINPNVAVEVAYVDLGEAEEGYGPDGWGKYGTETESASGLSIAVLGMSEQDGGLSIYGKIGLFMWDAEYKDVYDGATWYEASDDGSDIFFGIGIMKELSEGKMLRAGLDMFTCGTGAGDEDITRFSVGIMIPIQ